MKKLLFRLSFVAVILVMATGAWASNGDVVKWSQPPDMKYGVNIRSTGVEPIVADDWKCEDPRPVTDGRLEVIPNRGGGFLGTGASYNVGSGPISVGAAPMSNGARSPLDMVVASDGSEVSKAG